MKINIEKFEELAKRKKYKDGLALFKELNGARLSYNLIKKGYRVNYEIVKNLYNKFGERELIDVIIWEDETINGLKAKYVQVGNLLY